MKRNAKRRVKKNRIWQSAFREIRQSLGRFLAILAIVALGVGFFAGLKITRTAMVQTTGRYLENHSFYDYRLLSTLGFEAEDVAFLAGGESAEAVEGAVSFDIIYTTREGREGVVKAHSITEKVNTLKVVAGRMPQSAEECVVDSNLFSQDLIGEKVILSENNATEDLEHFTYREYTVVGIVQSPLYIQFERGNTSLGSGRVDGFIYLPREGFAEEYDTEVYVKLAENFDLYSDAYQEYLEQVHPAWEKLTGQAAHMRYERIVKEADEELADARRELEKEKADAGKELEDARKELEEAAEQLADGEKALEEARVELADGKKTLAEEERTLADARDTIAAKEKEMADGERQLSESRAKWDEENNKLSASRTALAQAEEQFKTQEQEYLTAKEELQAGGEQLQAAETAMQEQRQQLEEQSAYLDGIEASYGDAIPEDVVAFLAEKRQEIAGGFALLEEGRLELETRKEELEGGKLSLAEGKEKLDAYRTQLDGLQAQLESGQNALNGAKAQIDAGWRELENGKKALEEAKKELADGEKAIADAHKELADGEKTLGEKEKELADARLEYEDGCKEYEEGLAEYEEGIAEAEAKIADAEEEIADIEEPDTYVLGRDTNIGYVCFENDSNIVEGIANVFPVFFFLVAALVCVTTMNRMVEEQRTQIGVLKALGYGELTIGTKYMLYSGSAAVAGALLGFAGGTWIFPRVIWTAYGIMYRVESMVYVFDVWLAVISLAVALVCSVGATWFSCRLELAEVAAQLMRPKAPRAGKRVFLEYLPFVWKRLKFLKKVSVRNIFRYKKRLVMMVLGISGCSALLVTGFGIKDSIANVGGQQFGEIHIYDLSVTFSDEVTDACRQWMEEQGIVSRQYAPVMEKTMDIVTENGRKSVSLVVLDDTVDMSPYLNLHTMDKEPIAFPGQGEIVLTDKIAGNLDVAVGDSIILQDDKMQTITVKVAGIGRNFIYNYAYMGSATYEEAVGKRPEYKTLWLNLEETQDAHLLSAALMKGENVTGVSVNADIMERFNSMMQSLDLIVVVVILCAAGLAFIVLYNLTNINITERIREIATIKVLGFYPRETSSYVFRENTMLAAMGAAVGLFLGKLLHLFVMKQINIDMVAFDVHIRIISYVYSVLLTFLFAWLINRMMSGKLEKISMTESLKSVD